MAHDGRPTGADPYDVRDLVDWLEPVVSLDPAQLAAAVQRRMPRTIAAWQGWHVDDAEAVPLVVANAVDPVASAETAGYLRHVIRPGAELAVDREWQVMPDQRYLSIVISRPPGVTPSRLEVRVDGFSVAVGDVPEARPGHQPPPLLLPLDRFVGRTIVVELVHLPKDEKSLVDWHAIEPIDAPGTPETVPEGTLLKDAAARP
jgi:hypothetical protein